MPSASIDSNPPVSPVAALSPLGGIEQTPGHFVEVCQCSLKTKEQKRPDNINRTARRQKIDNCTRPKHNTTLEHSTPTTHTHNHAHQHTHLVHGFRVLLRRGARAIHLKVVQREREPFLSLLGHHEGAHITVLVTKQGHFPPDQIPIKTPPFLLNSKLSLFLLVNERVAAFLYSSLSLPPATLPCALRFSLIQFISPH